jgi:hypothetical protein
MTRYLCDAVRSCAKGVDAEPLHHAHYAKGAVPISQAIEYNRSRVRIKGRVVG